MFSTYNILAFIIYFVYGICIGSFLNVCIYRIPIKSSISHGRSMCTSCNTTLKPIDLIPIFSYLFLKGKCRYCGESISFRYPFVEFITGITFGLTAIQYGITMYSVLVCIYISVLIVACFIDIDYIIIPDRLHIIILMLSILSMFINSNHSLSNRLLGALVIGGIMFLISFFTGGGIGGGDIKLMAASGLLLGFTLNVFAFFLAYFIAGILLIIPYMMKKISKSTQIPMAPYFTIALIISILYGQQIINWYLSLF